MITSQHKIQQRHSFSFICCLGNFCSLLKAFALFCLSLHCYWIMRESGVEWYLDFLLSPFWIKKKIAFFTERDQERETTLLRSSFLFFFLSSLLSFVLLNENCIVFQTSFLHRISKKYFLNWMDCGRKDFKKL
jgi:hypothetical protein